MRGRSSSVSGRRKLAIISHDNGLIRWPSSLFLLLLLLILPLLLLLLMTMEILKVAVVAAAVDVAVAVAVAVDPRLIFLLAGA